MKTWIPDARNFAYLTWKQVDALPHASTLLVLPTAAIEQHGHHLPLATDTLINNLLLGKALAQLPPGPAYLRAAACLLWQEQRACGFSRHAFGDCANLSCPGARSGRKRCGKRIQEGRPLEHAWRKFVAGRRAGSRSAHEVRPSHLLAFRFGGRGV
jgi:hypothetical protein